MTELLREFQNFCLENESFLFFLYMVLGILPTIKEKSATMRPAIFSEIIFCSAIQL